MTDNVLFFLWVCHINDSTRCLIDPVESFYPFLKHVNWVYSSFKSYNTFWLKGPNSFPQKEDLYMLKITTQTLWAFLWCVWWNNFADFNDFHNFSLINLYCVQNLLIGIKMCLRLSFNQFSQVMLPSASCYKAI